MQSLKFKTRPYAYFCPSGWSRLSISSKGAGGKFYLNDDEYITAYHGTKFHFVQSILEKGLKAAIAHSNADQPTAYFSTSINYVAHPRYSQAFILNSNEPKILAQVVIVARLKKSKVYKTWKNTLGGNDIDINFPNNNDLELLAGIPQGQEYLSEPDCAIVGIMTRAWVDGIPPEDSKWWGENWRNSIQ
jgi:hypothetical protein